jgi:hypothetical protein
LNEVVTVVNTLVVFHGITISRQALRVLWGVDPTGDLMNPHAVSAALALTRGSVNQVSGHEHTQGLLVNDSAEDGAKSGRFQ